MASRLVSPAARLRGEISPPPDKSISHRAVMLACLAEGTSRIENFLQAEDCLSTVQACQAMGVPIRLAGQGPMTVSGKGLSGLSQPSREVYCGNSGTTMRLLLGILAGQPFIATLTGDESLSRRPMKRVTEPLRLMGAKIQGPDDGNLPPLTIKGGELRGIAFTNKVASAQVKSAILLAGLFAEGETEVSEGIPTRDHTERMFERFGAPCVREGTRIVTRKAKPLHPQEIRIPGDISSAAFLIVAALLSRDSDVLIRGVGLNPTRKAVLDVLRKMGGEIKVENLREDWEPTGDIRVRSSTLKGIKITKRLVPALIDELPVLMVACAGAEGKSQLTGAEELRVKETDRIKALCTNFEKLGVKVKELPDGCLIDGRPEFEGGEVESFGDHRIALAMAVAALRAPAGLKILGSECVGISYPQFFEDLERLRY